MQDVTPLPGVRMQDVTPVPRQDRDRTARRQVRGDAAAGRASRRRRSDWQRYRARAAVMSTSPAAASAADVRMQDLTRSRPMCECKT